MPMLLLFPLLAAAPDAALLERVAKRTLALEEFQKNAQLTMNVEAQELDDEGAVKHREVSVLRISRSGGDQKRELLKKTVDGEDVTAAEQQKLKEKGEQPKGRRTSLAAISPFHPDQQPKYAFELLAPPKSGPPRVRIAFRPKGEKDAELMMGDAVVDEETGDLLSLSMRPSKLPTLVDHVSVEVRLEAKTPAGMALSKMVMQGSAGLLFMKKRFKVVMTAGDYQTVVP